MRVRQVADNELAIEVLRDIADEERVHAGEFLRFLYELAPDEKKSMTKVPKKFKR